MHNVLLQASKPVGLLYKRPNPAVVIGELPFTLLQPSVEFNDVGILQDGSEHHDYKGTMGNSYSCAELICGPVDAHDKVALPLEVGIVWRFATVAYVVGFCAVMAGGRGTTLGGPDAILTEEKSLCLLVSRRDSSGGLGAVVH